MTYLQSYIDIKNHGYSIFENAQESGWLFILKVFATNDLHYTLFFSFVALIQICLIIYSVKEYPRLIPYVLFVFLCNNWFGYYQNVLRQAVTITIFLIIAIRIEKIKFWWYLLICMFSFFIHKTAILMIILYPVLKYPWELRINSMILSIIFLFCCIIGRLNDVFTLLTKIPLFEQILIFADYTSYITNDKLETGLDQSIGIGYLLKIILNLIVINTYVEQRNCNIITMYNALFILYFSGTCLNALAPTSLLSRPLWYLLVFQIPVYATALYYFIDLAKSNKRFFIKPRRLIGYFMILSMLLSFYTSNVIKPQSGNMEYKFWWQDKRGRIL